MEGGIRVIGEFIRQNSPKTIFTGGWKRRDNHSREASNPIPQLSFIANSVVDRCSSILQLSTVELQHRFEKELPDFIEEHSTYARNLLEFCSYQALHSICQQPDYLADKGFRRLTYDMMLAWEEPGIGCESLFRENTSCNDEESEEEAGTSLFYLNSTSMAVQVGEKKTVGREAFARIAPACPAIADIITVHNLFDALTNSSGGRLHFLIYDKYLGSLNKVLRNAKAASSPPLFSSLPLCKGEIILDVDGTNPIQPVLQHVGLSAWPGRLTLTNHALYFESLGVGLYDEAVIYDLASDLKQVVKPELTGPLGARLFDKAVMYKSITITEPVYLEFPEFKGNSRRDYWLQIIREILYVHKFIRKFGLQEIEKEEILSKAALGVFQYRAIRDAFYIFPSHFKTLLPFNMAEILPGGDAILSTLANHLNELKNEFQNAGEGYVDAKIQPLSPVSFLSLAKLGFILKDVEIPETQRWLVGEVSVGKTNPLEIAVKQLKCESGKAEEAQATVDQVKVEGIDTNLSVMKELLFPLLESFKRLQYLASWEDPLKSSFFLVFICYAIYRGCIHLILPSILVFMALFMIWKKYQSNGKPLEAFKVISHPSRNAVEQLLILQEAVSQFESLVQAGNIILLKLRALLLAAVPQVTEKVALFLVVMAVVFAVVPLRYVMIIIFLEMYTSEMPWRKESSDKLARRIREWWIRIPAAPVQLIRTEDKKRR